MPNPLNRTQLPPTTAMAGTSGYVDAEAIAEPGALLPSQGLPFDVMVLYGEGAPVDGTEGTGAGQAGPGSQYTDVTGANLYLNGGTKASPTWKLVTRAV